MENKNRITNQAWQCGEKELQVRSQQKTETANKRKTGRGTRKMRDCKAGPAERAARVEVKCVSTTPLQEGQVRVSTKVNKRNVQSEPNLRMTAQAKGCTD